MPHSASKIDAATDLLFFQVRPQSVPTNVPLRFDIYLMFHKKPVVFRRAGDRLSPERIEHLVQHGAQMFLIPQEQRHLSPNAERLCQ
jgi:hypothetical protein